MFDIATIICAVVATATTIHGPGMETAFITTGLSRKSLIRRNTCIVVSADARCKAGFHDAVLS
jgi:hypothetical protein